MKTSKEEVISDLGSLTFEQLGELVKSSEQTSFADDSFVRTFCGKHFGDIPYLPMQLQQLYPILCYFLYNKFSEPSL